MNEFINLNKEENNKDYLFLKFQKQAEEFGGRLDIDDWKYIQLLKKNSNELLGHIISTNDPGSIDTIFVDDLWVDGSMRGKGVASFLVNAFEQLALQHGIKKIRLFASGGGDLVSFYKKLGYNREAPKSTIMIKILT